MKKCRLLILLMGLALFVPGCGFDDSEDSTVVVIEATPTPEPTPTPAVTPTPAATPTPAPVIEQTASGVNIEKREGTYVAAAPLNLRADCSAEAELVGSVPEGTELTSTGAVITAVVSNPNAIGYASLSAVNDTVKTVLVNGVAPSEETVLSGDYQIQRPFVFVTKTDTALSEAAQQFFDFALSADASDVIADAGAVPLV